MKVLGFGPIPAEVMVVSEAPGFDEETSGYPFYDFDFYRRHSDRYVPHIRNGGKSGRELTRYMLRSAKIPRETAYVTNLVKYRPETRKSGKGNSPPTAADIKRDEPELVKELIDVQPKVVVAVGRYAARWFLGNVSVEDTHGLCFPVPEARREHIRRLADDLQVSRSDTHARRAVDANSQELRRVRAGADVQSSKVSSRSVGPQTKTKSNVAARRMARDRALDAWLDTLLVICVTHPAAGLHATDSQPQIALDFQLLGQYVRGEISTAPPVNRFPDPDYYEQRTPIAELSPRDVAVDTESRLDGSNIWGASFTFRPGSGAVVRARARHLLPSFRRMLSTHRVGLFNAPHDLRVLAKLYRQPVYEFASSMRFEDIMQMAYVYRLLPRGLKSLAKRYESMPMVPYRQVVGAADTEHAERYLLRVLAEVCPMCEGACLVLDDERVSEKTGKRLQAMAVTCPACEGDGTVWAPPEQHAEWDRDKQRVRISRGHRMGQRVRKALETKGTKPETVEDEQDVDDEYVGSLTEDDNDTNTDADTEPEQDDEKKPRGLRKWWTKDIKDYAFRMQVEECLGPMPEATLDDVDQRVAVDYSARDADATMRIWPRIEELVRAEGLWDVYEADRNAMPMICQMMDVGWRIDVDYLGELSNDLSAQMDVIEYRLEQLAGHYVNPNSSDQVASLLFDELGLTPIKITDTGKASTANKILKDLQLQAAASMDSDPEARRAFEATELAIAYRERSKLKSTYTVKLPRQIDENGRLHTLLKCASVASRRLSSEDPNLQNIPARTELGKSVRHAFWHDEGNVLLSCDYAQIEMRVLAHESGEKSLIRAIIDGLDVHALTTSKVFGIPLEKVTKSMWQRTVSKTLGFGIVYGISALALKAQIKLLGNMDVPEEQCQAWIEDYTHRSFPAIGEFMADSVAQARRYGYVADMWGHRRYLPGVHSELRGVRGEAERVATNHRIQAGASGIIKLAMAELEPVLRKYRKKGFCEPLLQIHDELAFEVKAENAEPFMHEVERVMGGVVELKVPVLAEGKIGERWKDLKD